MLRFLKIMPWVILALYMMLSACKKPDGDDKIAKRLVGSWRCHGWIGSSSNSSNYTSGAVDKVLIIGSDTKKVTSKSLTVIDEDGTEYGEAFQTVVNFGDSIVFYWDGSTPDRHTIKWMELKYYPELDEIKFEYVFSNRGGGHYSVELSGRN